MYDVIVIGSGTSGAAAAYWLQRGGAKVLLLEAGTHYRTEDFPMPEHLASARLFWGGGVEFNTRYDLAMLRGRCVGGTSVVNGGLMDRFDDVALDDWRAESGVDWFTLEAMTPHYDAAEREMALETIPEEHRNNNARLFIKGLENIGRGWKPLRRGQSDCAIDEGNDCISCLGGCHRGSKQSTMVTYVPRAQALGMELLAECQVRKLDHHQDKVTVHAVHAGTEKTFHTPKVVLACGALGNPQLLLNSGFGTKLHALGNAFTMHPQFMVFALHEEHVDAHKGVLQGAKSHDPVFRNGGYKLENVFAPPISTGLLFGRVGKDLHAFMRRYRYLSSIEIAVRDENTGRIRVNRKGELKVEKRLTDQDRKRGAAGLETVRQLYASLGVEELVESNFNFGLHLMGGCPMGSDAQRSVVNPAWQLHGHPNLYCADSSIFPNAPGVNPALTIMALAHRMAQELLKN